MQPAALLHGLSWQSDQPSMAIGLGALVGRVNRSPIGRAYRQLCRSRHVDDGDPLLFEVYVSIGADSPVYDRNVHFSDPYNAFCRVANLLVVAMTYPIGYARMIWPKEPSWPGHATALMWSVAEWTWPLEGDGGPWAKLNDAVTAQTATMWANANMGGLKRVYSSRLNTALTYFQHAWRSTHIEQACLHLSVALEVLFAPHTQSETTHQIAFNVAHFLGATSAEREALYDASRKFYSIRSAIVHGGTAEYDKVEPAVVKMFRILATVLQRILTDAPLAEAFESDVRRKALFRSFLFA